MKNLRFTIYELRFKNLKSKIVNLKSICLLLTAYCLLVSIPAYADTVGFFSSVEGRVDILKEGATSVVPVNLNDNVSMGDIVRTKSDGKAEITFKDDTSIRLAPSTRLKIDEYTFNPDRSRNKGALGLFRGKVRAVVSKTKGIIPVGLGASSFNINTPTAVAGVKGTDLFVFYDKGVTGVLFREGQGFVVNPNMPDKIVDITAGQITFIITPDLPPLPPRPATKVEMTQHAKDTAPAEKPKEKKGKGEIKEAKAGTKGVKDKADEKDKGETKEAKAEDVAATKKTAPAPAAEKAAISTLDMTRPEVTPTGGRDVLGLAPPTDFASMAGTVAADIKTTTLPDTTTLLPVTETQPQTLKNTDVTINAVFQ